MITMIIVPAVVAMLVVVIGNTVFRRLLLVAAAATHLVWTVSLWVKRPDSPITENGWLELDAVGLIFLTITSVLFFFATIHVIGSLIIEKKIAVKDSYSEGIYFACLLVFLLTMTIATMAQHLGLLWIVIEATTLATAPLIYFHRYNKSLEATWKYLIICSVGIALALLGTFFLSVSATSSESSEISLLVTDLANKAASLNISWLRAAFIFLVVGYGTKMGLAPMHTWLPDAHSEAPASVSALLSGALLNGAFLAILRVLQIMYPAGQAEFVQSILIVFGLISMLWAGVFILGQTDYKRMLAYSSVEHMGILALGAALGGPGIWAAILHAVNHSFTKGCLFFSAGNILERYGSKSAHAVAGLRRLMPYTGLLWVVGILAICGAPPFGLFFSEFAVLKAAFAQGNILTGILFLLFLGIVFVGMFTVMLRMTQGEPPVNSEERKECQETWLTILPPLAMALLVLVLGLNIPPQLWEILEEASKTIDPSYLGMPGGK